VMTGRVARQHEKDGSGRGCSIGTVWCLTTAALAFRNVVPALLERSDTPPEWLPTAALEADRVVLLLLDGLGWEQLQERRHLAPTLSSMEGGPISTVLPTTTATALTSLSTGTPPGEHGIIGYRFNVHGEVLNVLRWTTSAGDARHTIPPQKIQTQLPFLGHRPPVVTRAEFARTGFTMAHLDGTRFTGYRMASSLVTDLARLMRGPEPFRLRLLRGHRQGEPRIRAR